MAPRTPVFGTEQLDYIDFGGGLDVVTPPLKIPSGYCRNAQNYEIDINGGYTGITGYERYDGRVKPSDASYAILNATITGAFTVGAVLTGGTSGVYGTIAASTASSFILTKLSAGSFINGENLNITGPVTVATAVGTQTVSGASTAKLHAQYKNAAADIYRAAIAAPGTAGTSYPFLYNDVWYAFRGTGLYKSTAAGWVAVTLPFEISFSTAVLQPTEGQTIKGATSGATAILRRSVLQSGTWTGGTGRFIIDTITGTWQNGELIKDSTLATTYATSTSLATQITITAGGRYEFDIKNFGGQLDTKRVYGCDGVNRGFEFDGVTYVPIVTGMSPDTPSHVKVHKKHLFFSFKSSAQHSGIGTPYIWSVISGGAELAVGDNITNFQQLPGSETGGGSLAIITKNSTNILYGSAASGVDPWNLVNFNDEQGAISYTTQNIEGKVISLDAQGLISLATTANYGNFVSGALSQRIHTWLKTKIPNATASCISRDKSQYRVFFSDKYALYVTFSAGKIRGMMPMYFENAVSSVFSGEKNDGSEEICFGSTNGMVYMMEKGTSFDGADITGYLHLAWNSQKNVRQNKRYKRVMFEISGDGYSEFSFRYELGYYKSEISQPANQSAVVDFSPLFWDSGVAWDEFTWDGSELSPSSLSMEGSAENISLILRNSADYFSPMSFSGAMLHFSRRRGLR